jgi:hypothetical protein
LGLKIAQNAPLCNIVPPEYFSRTERVVSYLTEELVQKSHAVMFLASGASETNAWLGVADGRSLRLDKRYQGQTVKDQGVSEVA